MVVLETGVVGYKKMSQSQDTGDDSDFHTLRFRFARPSFKRFFLIQIRRSTFI